MLNRESFKYFSYHWDLRTHRDNLTIFKKKLKEVAITNLVTKRCARPSGHKLLSQFHRKPSVEQVTCTVQSEYFRVIKSYLGVILPW